ncbi:MAG TPA: PDZ domain-containing protein, partial [Firmicutes bacterium]|nr:PDZ domain-containing protein [Bacillota bacterium]
MRVARRRWSLQRVLLFFLALVGAGWGLAEWGAGLPADIHLMVGREQGYRLRWPIEVSVASGREQPVLRLAQAGSPHALLAGAAGGERGSLILSPLREGRAFLTLRLFGLIPLRQRQVTVLPELEVVPGGQAIGVLVAAQGMVVTGFSPVPVEGGRTEEPARRAGVRVGDLVTAVDGRPVYTATQLGVLVNAKRGRPVVLEIRRAGKKISFPVTPARVAGEQGSGWRKDRKGEWRLGLFVEDPTAGVGTLSFWEPRTRVYGALGHMITDGFSRQGVTLYDGRIIPAVIAGVQPGRRGQPGEKI